MRSEASSPLSLAEHRELGQAVGAVTGRLHELCDLVRNVYGPNNQAAFTFLQVTQQLDRLCEDLQSQARKDLPGYEVERLYKQ